MKVNFNKLVLKKDGVIIIAIWDILRNATSAVFPWQVKPEILHASSLPNEQSK